MLKRMHQRLQHPTGCQSAPECLLPEANGAKGFWGLGLALTAIVPSLVLSFAMEPVAAHPIVVTPGYPVFSRPVPNYRVRTNTIYIGPSRPHDPSIGRFPSQNRILDRRWDNWNQQNNWHERRGDDYRDYKRDDRGDFKEDYYRNHSGRFDRRYDHGNRRSVIIVPKAGYSSYPRSVYRTPTCGTQIVGGFNTLGKSGISIYSSRCY